ncbi:Rha family transcriptional regulator [Pseudomonas aeruginosa]|uniref:Rha family transcriptional regulator n=1 Tax=Pseudomonas aeruginosa TaxID=287 RepID=UPI002A6B2A40|nr:Rha family transcriptional regulator [Pseudomonas aeruginosa]MDY1207846.1 Rha family transcriptional regulator [Pseudomonas aeruginosa]
MQALEKAPHVQVKLVEGQITTTSVDVAAHFKKRHDTVLRAIRLLECSAEFTARNFAASEYTDPTGRKLKQFRMTRDGFAFLAMGFTGKEAAKWKEAYINAFNRLEQELRKHDSDTADTIVNELIGMTEVNVIKGLIRDKAKVIPIERRRSFQLTMHNRLHTRFNVPRVELIPADQFEAACNFVAAYSVHEGEWLPKPEKRCGTMLNDHQLYDVYFVCHHFRYLYDIFKRHSLYEFLGRHGSRAGVEMIDHFKDGYMGVWKLRRDFEEEFDAVQRRLRLNQYSNFSIR